MARETSSMNMPDRTPLPTELDQQLFAVFFDDGIWLASRALRPTVVLRGNPTVSWSLTLWGPRNAWKSRSFCHPPVPRPIQFAKNGPMSVYLKLIIVTIYIVQILPLRNLFHLSYSVVFFFYIASFLFSTAVCSKLSLHFQLQHFRKGFLAIALSTTSYASYSHSHCCHFGCVLRNSHLSIGGIVISLDESLPTIMSLISWLEASREKVVPLFLFRSIR